MIPRTFPSTFAANGQQQMVVYSLPSITGLTAWIDYIPVKGVTTESATLENTYANGGYQVVDSLASLTGKQAWLDYIPVYEDASYTKPWSTDAGGYIPTSALAALLLDFTSGRLDPRITFSRTTNATLTNSAGLVANAPMNLLTFSEQFDNAAWTKTSTAVTSNSTVAPDGTTTADTLVGTGSYPFIQGSVTYTAAAYTFSVFVKKSTGTFALAFSAAGAIDEVAFNLATGATTTAGANITSSGYVDQGLYWRVWAVSTRTAVISQPRIFTGYPTNVSPVVWGAQLELGSTATTYNPTTVKNLLGFTENFDNAAWTKSNAFVQTNLLTYSEDFDNAAWTPAGTVTPNVTLAPDGTLTADRCAVVSGAALSQIVNSITAGINYTVSVWVKSSATGGASNVRITTNNTGAWNTGISQIYALTSEWQRITISGAIISSGTSVRLMIGAYTVGGGGDATCAGNIDVWGAQLVQGTSAGDYKATYAAAAAVGYTNIYGQPFAQKLVEDTATNFHQVLQNVTVVAGTPYALSVYAKAGERNWMCVYEDSASSKVWFDLSTGTVGTVVNATANIQSLGNGWYRCTAIYTQSGTVGRTRIAVASANGTISYTGDGTSGIYIFGAQLSDSASVDPYVYNPVAAPSSVAYYGPRFDYDPVTLAPKGLLIEEQRSNLLTYSEQFDNAAWIKFTSSITANTTTAPDGITTADSLVSTSTGQTSVRQTISVTSGATYAASFYAKANTKTWARIEIGSAFKSVFFDLVNGVLGTVQSGVTASITAAGNGWYRCTATLAYPDTSGIYQITSAKSNGDVTSTIGDSIFIWGAQLEAGAFATSYIPTVASQVTRAADSASMIGNNFARWYNQTEGTVYAQVVDSSNYTGAPGWSAALAIDDNIAGYGNISLIRGGAAVAVVSATVSTGWTSPLGTAYKIALGLKGGNFSYAKNGVLDTAQASPANTPLNQTQISIGYLKTTGSSYLNGHISRIAYYNRRLSNTELQGITS